MKQPASPISYMVGVTRLPEKGMPISITADPEQCAALAGEHGLERVDAFSAELLLQRWKRDGVRVGGLVRASIVQACVVSLDPIESSIEAPVAAVFVPEGSRLARDDMQGGEIVVDVDAADLPETFSGGRIDVGALSEEFFALAIDPYPRKQAAVLEGLEDGAGEAEDESPLSQALGKLSAGR